MNYKDLGILLVFISTLVMCVCLSYVFSMEQTASILSQVLGHIVIMISAIGIKIGYIIWLAANDQQQ